MVKAWTVKLPILAFDKRSAVDKRITDVGGGLPAAPCDNKLVYQVLIPVGYICICNILTMKELARYSAESLTADLHHLYLYLLILRVEILL